MEQSLLYRKYILFTLESFRALLYYIYVKFKRELNSKNEYGTLLLQEAENVPSHSLDGQGKCKCKVVGWVAFIISIIRDFYACYKLHERAIQRHIIPTESLFPP